MQTADSNSFLPIVDTRRRVTSYKEQRNKQTNHDFDKEEKRVCRDLEREERKEGRKEGRKSGWKK